jgi:hypothetical protein
VQLGYSPRVEIAVGDHPVRSMCRSTRRRHRHHRAPHHWLVDALAAAYGIAVTGTMAITTVLACVVARRVFKWNKFVAGSLTAVFVTVDLLRRQR